MEGTFYCCYIVVVVVVAADVVVAVAAAAAVIATGVLCCGTFDSPGSEESTAKSDQRSGHGQSRPHQGLLQKSRFLGFVRLGFLLALRDLAGKLLQLFTIGHVVQMGWNEPAARY